MASTSSSNHQFSSTPNDHLIPEFDGEDYDFWFVKMKTIFQSLNQWEIVEKGYEEPSEGANVSEINPKSWINQDKPMQVAFQ